MVWFIAFAALAGEQEAPKNPFVWEVPTFAVDAIPVSLTIPKEHSVYADRLVVRASKGVLGEWKLPPAKLQADPTKPGVLRASWTEDLSFEVPVSSVSDGEVVLELEQQGCGKGLCWPITTTTHTVRVTLTKGS